MPAGTNSTPLATETAAWHSTTATSAAAAGAGQTLSGRAQHKCRRYVQLRSADPSLSLSLVLNAHSLHKLLKLSSRQPSHFVLYLSLYTKHLYSKLMYMLHTFCHTPYTLFYLFFFYKYSSSFHSSPISTVYYDSDSIFHIYRLPKVTSTYFHSAIFVGAQQAIPSKQTNRITSEGWLHIFGSP